MEMNKNLMQYLNEKINASTPIWAGADVDAFLDEIRGGQL